MFKPSPYLHWEELRRRPPPEGLDHLAWWGLVKVGRHLCRREIPLVDPRGRPFGWSWHDAFAEILHQVDHSLGGEAGILEPTTPPASRRHYHFHSLVTEAITSSQLEGASTTREVARDMLGSGRAPRDQSERMILNNYMTMERIIELRGAPLTPEMILELHRLVTADTLTRPDAAGRLRRSDERVEVVDAGDGVMHTPPLAETLVDRLHAMCAFANDTAGTPFIHPAIRAIILHFWIAYDHPFVDGNGRTARALFYWSMLRSGYWIFEYVSISAMILKAPVKYGRAFLFTETDENDLTYFILYHLEVIREALEGLSRFVESRSSEASALEALAREGVDELNHRQRTLLSHALRHPGGDYTIAGHQRRQQVVYQTARADLLDLAARGLLTRYKAGRKLVFRPPTDLERRLRRLGGTRK